MNKKIIWNIIDAGSGVEDPLSALKTALRDKTAAQKVLEHINK